MYRAFTHYEMFSNSHFIHVTKSIRLYFSGLPCSRTQGQTASKSWNWTGTPIPICLLCLLLCYVCRPTGNVQEQGFLNRISKNLQHSKWCRPTEHCSNVDELNCLESPGWCLWWWWWCLWWWWWWGNCTVESSDWTATESVSEDFFFLEILSLMLGKTEYMNIWISYPTPLHSPLENEACRGVFLKLP